MAFLKLEVDDGLPVDKKLKAFLIEKEAGRDAPISNEQMAKVKAKELEINPDTASLADISYDSVLIMALSAYENGDIETFREETHQQMQVEDLKVVRTPYVVNGSQQDQTQTSRHPFCQTASLTSLTSADKRLAEKW